MTTLYTVENLR